MAHSGSATEHMLGYIKLIARKEPDVSIFPTGTSDLTNGVNTMKKVRKLVRGIRGIDENEINMGFSRSTNPRFREGNNPDHVLSNLHRDNPSD